MANSYDTVVVPVDFSDQSIAAVDFAREMTSDPTGVHVIHVLPELSAAEPGMIWDTIDPESRRAHAKEALLDRLDSQVRQGVQCEVVIGDAGHCIADHAKNVNAQLIVMPSHGRRGLKRLLLGSVAERVLRLAGCNVLIIKQPQ